MTNPTIDGVEVAAESEVVAEQAQIASFQAHLDALSATPGVAAADVQAIKDGMAALQAKQAADEALIAADHPLVQSLVAHVAALSTAAPAAPQLTNAQIVAAILSALGATANTGSAAAVGAAPAVNYFPADPGLAPPSPQGSKSLVIKDAVTGALSLSGQKYLVGSDTSIYSFTNPAGTANPGPITPLQTGYVLYENGVPQGWAVDEILAFAGVIELHYNGGYWGHIVSQGVVSRDPAPDLSSAAAPATPTPTTPTATGTVPVDPTPLSPAPGTSGKIIPASPGSLASTEMGASAGDTVQAAAGVYNESAGIDKPLLIDGGGKVSNPGDAAATYTASAILDASGVTTLREGQGGFVPLSDAWIRGWEVRGFGRAAAGHDGTGGIRNNRDGTFLIEDCFIHVNQMGVGPHTGGPSLLHIKNTILLNNGLPQDPGYAHNIYGAATHIIAEGLTSIVEAGNGDGHAGKFACPVLEIVGKNYFRAWHTSSIDIPHGTVTPFSIKGDANGGTTVEKFDEGTDNLANHVLFGYGTEDQVNGNAGGFISNLTFKIPNNGVTYYVISSGPLVFDSTCKFVYTDGTPVKAGAIAPSGTGTVTGLPV